MSRKIFILSLLWCFAAINIHARQVITGSLVNKETAKPVDGATVELLQLPDSVSVETVKTNSEGLFMFYKGDTLNTYCVRVKHMIYKPASQAVMRKPKNMINNVGMISLEPKTYNLKEIVVNGSKVTVTELGDRTIYGIPSEFQKTSTDGVDILRKIPSVQVDYLNEDITVNGKTNIKIEVDGVTRDKAYLKRLHPSQISKMEIITSPSGKYDADVDAVINVITNPAMRYGLKGMINLGSMLVTRNSYMGVTNGSLDYGLEKVSYYVAANYVPQHFNMGSEMNRDAANTSIRQKTGIGYEGNYANVNAGIIYDPDKLNDFNLNFSYNNSSTENHNNAWNYHSLDGNLASILKTASHSKTGNDGLTSSLFYKHKFDEKTQHGLEAELNYYNSLNNHTKTDFTNTYYNPADTSELYSSPLRNEFTDTKVRNLWTQANYTLPFDSVYTFNAGMSANLNHYLTDNTSSLTAVSNMDYTDFRLGAFAELSRTFKKGSLRIGSRFESSKVTVNTSDPHTYHAPLPYLNGTYNFSDRNSLKMAYSRRVIRPNSGQLNPFVSTVDSQTISHGNMNLKPAYRDNLQLTYNTRLSIRKLTFNLSPQLFYEYKTGLIQNIITQNSVTKIFESVPTNISNGYEYGGILALNSQIGKVMFNSNFRYFFNHVDRYLTQIDPTNRQSWNWNSFLICPLPLNMQLISMFYLTGPVLDGQMETRSSGFYMAGINKQFKNNSAIRIFAFNPFSGKFFDNTTTIRNQNLYQRQHTYMDKNYGIMLMYAYNFKVGKSIEKQKHNVEQQIQNNMINVPVTF